MPSYPFRSHAETPFSYSYNTIIIELLIGQLSFGGLLVLVTLGEAAFFLRPNCYHPPIPRNTAERCTSCTVDALVL